MVQLKENENLNESSTLKPEKTDFKASNFVTDQIMVNEPEIFSKYPVSKLSIKSVAANVL